VKNYFKETKIEVASNVNLKPSTGFRETASDKMGKFARSFFDSIQVIVIALAVVVLVYLFVASFNIVDGCSMYPNFEPQDLIISEKITTTWGKLGRGDVIVFQASTGKDFIKRLIGMPGDRVKVQGGKVYINGEILNEDYLSESNKNIDSGTYLQEGLEITVAPDHYIAMGDNRKNSLDSRNIGQIEKDKIKGKAWLVFWPFNKFHMVQHSGLYGTVNDAVTCK
jgi:signal peptidase I